MTMIPAPTVLYDHGAYLVTTLTAPEPRVIRHGWRYYGVDSVGTEPTLAGPVFRLVYRLIDPRLN